MQLKRITNFVSLPTFKLIMFIFPSTGNLLSYSVFFCIQVQYSYFLGCHPAVSKMNWDKSAIGRLKSKFCLPGKSCSVQNVEYWHGKQWSQALFPSLVPILLFAGKKSSISKIVLIHYRFLASFECTKYKWIETLTVGIRGSYGKVHIT